MSCKSQKCDIFILINFSFDGCIVVGLTPSLVSTSLLVFFFFHCCSHGYTPTWSKSQLKHKIRRFKAILRLVFWSISSLCANAAALCPLSVPLIVIVPLKDYIILFAPSPPHFSNFVGVQPFLPRDNWLIHFCVTPPPPDPQNRARVGVWAGLRCHVQPITKSHLPVQINCFTVTTSAVKARQYWVKTKNWKCFACVVHSWCVLSAMTWVVVCWCHLVVEHQNCPCPVYGGIIEMMAFMLFKCNLWPPVFLRCSIWWWINVFTALQWVFLWVFVSPAHSADMHGSLASGLHGCSAPESKMSLCYLFHE